MSETPKCQWPGCDREPEAKREGQGAPPKYCGRDGHTSTAAAKARHKKRLESASAAQTEAATAAAELSKTLPAEGRIRQQVMALLSGIQKASNATNAQTELLDQVLTELAEWKDEERVQERLRVAHAERDQAADEAQRAKDDAEEMKTERTAMERSLNTAMSEAATARTARDTAQEEAAAAVERAQELELENKQLKKKAKDANEAKVTADRAVADMKSERDAAHNAQLAVETEMKVQTAERERAEQARDKALETIGELRAELKAAQA
jgi:chromosome segregation ATPase